MRTQVNINGKMKAGVINACARIIAVGVNGVTSSNLLPLPSHLHLLPYPKSGLAGYCVMENKI